MTITTGYAGEPCDVLIAMHARRSAPAVRRFKRAYPERPLILALTGTDLYGDLRYSRQAQCAVALATRLVVLQPCGKQALSPRLRSKTHVIYQSAVPIRPRRLRRAATFDVCVVANLRSLKDPLRTALAARRLPATSRVRVVHVGVALSPAQARRARAEMRRNRRYRWLGERPHARVRALLAGSRLMALTSRMEGGANVVSEAVAASLPLLASRIPGSVGLLGTRYPGFFPVGDTKALARLLHRAETDTRFYRQLQTACHRRAHLFEATRERRSWERLLASDLLIRSRPPDPEKMEKQLMVTTWSEVAGHGD